jgi:hypothetical protein
MAMNWNNDAAGRSVESGAGANAVPVRGGHRNAIAARPACIAEADGKNRVGGGDGDSGVGAQHAEALRPDLPRLMEKFGLDSGEYRHLLE